MFSRVFDQSQSPLLFLSMKAILLLKTEDVKQSSVILTSSLPFVQNLLHLFHFLLICSRITPLARGQQLGFVCPIGFRIGGGLYFMKLKFLTKKLAAFKCAKQAHSVYKQHHDMNAFLAYVVRFLFHFHKRNDGICQIFNSNLPFSSLANI